MGLLDRKTDLKTRDQFTNGLTGKVMDIYSTS